MIFDIVLSVSLITCCYMLLKHIKRTHHLTELYELARRWNAELDSNDVGCLTTADRDRVCGNIVFDYIHIDFAKEAWHGEPFDKTLACPERLCLLIKDQYKSWKKLRDQPATFCTFGSQDASLLEAKLAIEQLDAKTVEECVVVAATIIGGMDHRSFQKLLRI